MLLACSDASPSLAPTEVVEPDAGAAGETGTDAADDAALDAPAPDGATEETASDASPETPKGCPALFCDGFESEADGAPPDPKVWTKAITGKGTIAVTSELAHSGSNSLKIVSPSGSYETFVKETVTFPAAKNSFWGRVWFRFEEKMPADFVHWTLFEARGKGSNNRIRYGGINNPHGGAFFTNAFLFNVETQGMGEKGLDDDPKPELPEKTWICVEWQYVGEAGKYEARLFWNGAERPKVHADTAWFETKFVMPELDALYLGWAIYQPIAKPYVVHVDDVAIGESRIGCD